MRASEETEKTKSAVKNSHKDFLHKVKGFLIKWHLPIFLLIALIFGASYPSLGDSANDAVLRGACFTLKDDEKACAYDNVANYFIGLIFLISGIRLKTDEFTAAIKEWKAALLGVGSLLFLSPLLTFWFVEWNFKIPQFALGLSIFFTQATTLSSAVLITEQGKGNVALALLITICSNMLSVVTMPLFVVRNVNRFVEKHGSEFQEDGIDVEVDAVPIIIELVFVIVIPIIVGKVFRSHSRVRNVAMAHGVLFNVLSSLFLAMIVWMTISNSAGDLKALEGKSIVLLFVCGLGIHFFLLAFNYFLSHYVLRLELKEQRAVVICASQKTLPIALTVLELLDETIIGSKGLVAIPMIASHFMQIVADAFVAAYWAGKPLEAVLDEPYSESEPDEEDTQQTSEHVLDDSQHSENFEVKNKVDPEEVTAY